MTIGMTMEENFDQALACFVKLDLFTALWYAYFISFAVVLSKYC